MKPAIIATLHSKSWLAGFLTVLIANANPTAPGTKANYFPLTTSHRQPAPFGSASIMVGPKQLVNGRNYYWWQLELRKEADFGARPLCAMRALTAEFPWASKGNAVDFARYQLRIFATDETLDYRDARSGKALLPTWKDFQAYFLPRRSWGNLAPEGVPETATLLGHVLTLHHVRHNVPWEEWPASKTLALNRELLIGTARNFKDSEGKRLPQTPQRQNYNYVRFTEADYQVMLAAGVNLFTVDATQQPWIRNEPVFFVHYSGEVALNYPVELYRANYLGATMFIDEPTSIMTGDTNIHRTLRYFSDAAAVIQMRTHEIANSAREGAFRLEQQLLKQNVNLGDMRLEQEFPSWETWYETAYYQMAGGTRGIVHEGRYQLAPFDAAVQKFTGRERRHTARELLLYHYAFLRGAARAFNKHWGTAIYGQCDPAISPEALSLAYDMGARYLWFWTSDHDHHMPWPEQMELVRTLKKHAAANPRPSNFGPQPTLDVAIVIPNGYFLSLENLWWVRVMDKEGKNEAAQKYQRLMKRALDAVHQCLERNQSFDILVDDGRKIQGYRKIVRVEDRPE